MRSLCQQHGHHLGAHQKCRISGPTPGQLYQQEESVNSPSGSDTNHFKAVTGRAGGVCASESPGDLLKIHLQGSAPGAPGGLEGGGRGLCILKKLLGDSEATSGLRIYPLK